MNVTSGNFGIVIAYVLPGFVILWGLSFHSAAVRGWLGTVPASEATVGGFLYATLGSLGAGLVASTLRWLIVDTLHHATGVRRPRWDFTRLAERVTGFQVLVEVHYRYYQHASNTLVAVLFADVAYQLAEGLHGVCMFVGVIALEGLLWIGSRDAITKYYHRCEQLLRESARGAKRE